MLGLAGYAGEAGHMMVNPHGRPCRCGATGCWETEVGEEALLERAGMTKWTGESPISEIGLRADEGDPAIHAALWEIGRWLGIGIGNLINILNPEVVVVGGFYHALYPAMAPAIEVGAKDVTLDAPWEATSIRRSELGDDVLLLGAAELVLAEVISDPAAHIADARS
jgi:predicted NBD/HSP70 family sugar kinase